MTASLIVAVDESGSPSRTVDEPFCLGISVILDVDRFRDSYREVSERVFGREAVFKYSHDRPKPGKAGRVKDEFISLLSRHILAIGIVIYKEEDIGNLVLEVYGKLVALHLERILGKRKASHVGLIYDRNPLFREDQKTLLANSFHKWVRLGSHSFTVKFGGKDKDIWVSSADYVAGLTREMTLCQGRKISDMEYCERVGLWFKGLNVSRSVYRTSDIRRMFLR